ncbi:phage holin, LL-H family [Caldicellulosiruptor owensensis OL]|uniref:Phage holin, LL-H family n=1 Tax=Caldicellulosiruptor owensensis (strain ATCC 700167 / DSM 13100 / OL) TaxID=632518 RepID=E4Q639_CALOW|nr:phage holin [Caldicellulosiruptor owensensis]ADQ04413.1 phage holin, LL-H family [Caldicellulosiruptor owensensis OL]
MREAVLQVFIYILQAVIVVLGTFIVAYVKKRLELLQQKIGQERYLLLVEVANNLVKAIEQTFGAGQGELKRSEAIKFLMQNFKLTEDEAEKLVEAAVFEMNKVLKGSNTMQQ